MTSAIKLGDRLYDGHLLTVSETDGCNLQKLIRIGTIYQFTKTKLRCSEQATPFLQPYPPNGHTV